MTNLVPYGFNLTFKSERLPDVEPNGLGNGLAAMGVWFTFSSEHLEFLLDKVQTWYQDRDEVVLIDYGTSDKQGRGCIIMEWQGFAIDQLFEDILRTEDMIEDYCVYEVQA